MSNFFQSLSAKEASELKGKIAINKYIEQFLDVHNSKLQLEPHEIELLKKYTGYGGKVGESDAEHGGEIYEFYTPDYVCKLMWELAQHYGFDKGKILEPSCGNGNLLAHIPEGNAITAFEINPYSARIAGLLYAAKVYPYEFEKAFLEGAMWNRAMKKKVTWLEDYPFDLVIGNPPYGLHSGYYSALFPKKYKRIEFFFIQKGLELLKNEGLMVFLVPSLFMMNADKYNPTKKEIAEVAELVDAYRIGSVFAGTRLMGDVLIFRKSNTHDKNETYRLLSADTFFKENSQKSAGIPKSRNTKREGAFYYELKATQEEIEEMVQKSVFKSKIRTCTEKLKRV